MSSSLLQDDLYFVMKYFVWTHQMQFDVVFLDNNGDMIDPFNPLRVSTRGSTSDTTKT